MQINLIDTPGHVDFTMEVERSLRVLDGAVCVFCAVGGVQPQSETVWHQADRYRVPRLVFVNKMDRMGADFKAVIAEIQTKLGAVPVVLSIPMGQAETFCGVIDLLAMTALTFEEGDQGVTVVRAPIPAAYAAEAERARAELVERIAGDDESLLDTYLENPDIPAERLIPAIRRATIASRIVPVFCGSSLRNKGVQCLLDGVVDFLPSPEDRPEIAGTDLKTGAAVARACNDGELLAALVFKVATDPYVGRLFFVRIYSGVLRRGQNVFNPRTHKRERILRLVRLQADSQSDVDALHAGEIGALVGLKGATTGDTLCTEHQPLVLERIVAPEPVMFMAIEPKSRADRDKLETALKSLSDEDPTCIVRVDADTGQLILSGMGELHLDVLVDRLRREFNVSANTGRPMVSYYETVMGPGRGSYIFDREIGGKRLYAEVSVEVAPRPRGSGVTTEAKRACRDVPEALAEAVDLGLADGISTGVLARYPMIDLAASVTAVKMGDAENALPVAFRTAAVMAFRAAAEAAQPELLEPIMELVIVTPPEHVGEIIGDVNARRGQVRDMEERGGTKVVRAGVPLAELFGYSTGIRSLSRGRASYTMEPDEFSVVPRAIRDQLLNR
jgi:elongation factor G